MTPYRAYELYVAMKCHFNSNYDIFKFGTRPKNLTYESFEKRHDKAFFYTISKEPFPAEIFLANFIENDELWIGDLVMNQSAIINHIKWKSRKQSLTYQFKSDINKLDNELAHNFYVHKNQYPLVIKLYLQGEICIESFVILNMIFSFIEKFDKTHLVDDYIWSKHKQKIIKYTPFIKIDTKKYKSILKERYKHAITKRSEEKQSQAISSTSTENGRVEQQGIRHNG